MYAISNLPLDLLETRFKMLIYLNVSQDNVFLLTLNSPLLLNIKKNLGKTLTCGYTTKNAMLERPGLPQFH